jgi:hypothetical protein
VKAFIFGRSIEDPKGPEAEHGEERVDAPSAGEARAAFIETFGARDPRKDIVRVARPDEVESDPVEGAEDESEDKPRKRKRKAA